MPNFNFQTCPYCGVTYIADTFNAKNPHRCGAKAGNSMTRTEARTAIAERVMGWHPLTAEEQGQEYPCFYLHNDKLFVQLSDEGIDRIWSPDISPTDALDMLEKWCEMRAGARRYEHRRYRIGGLHYVSLLEGRTRFGYSEVASFPEAVFAAMCAAEGIEVIENDDLQGHHN